MQLCSKWVISLLFSTTVQTAFSLNIHTCASSPNQSFQYYGFEAGLRCNQTKQQ